MEWSDLRDVTEPLQGLFWVCGEYPETDGDVNDYGEPVGWYTGKLEPFVSLVYLEYDPADPGGLVVEPVNEYETGGFEDDWHITHFMPFEKPVHVAASKNTQPAACP